MHIKHIPNVILSCCVLHNICEIHNDTFHEEWLQDVDLTQPGDTSSSTTATSGSTVRDLLVTSLMITLYRCTYNDLLYNIFLLSNVCV